MATKKQPYRQPALEPFDFDEVMAELDRLKPQPEQAPSSGLRRALGDTGVSALKGAIAVPEAMVGMADLVTGGYAGKAAESLGFRPREAKAALEELYSPEQQVANREVQQAQGFVGTAAAALRNPSTILHAAVESAPSLLPAGAVARGALALAPRMGGALAAGIGEGMVSAGQTAEQVRQETADGLLTAGQSALAASSGGLTGIIGSVAGKVANRLGIGDVNQLVAGVRREGPEAQKAFARKLLEGFATEGVLQELPQSAQEQIAQNVALGKPWDEGVGNAAAMGALAGGAMGGAAAPLGHGASSRPALLPESGPMTRAANAGAEVAASQPLPAATDGTTLPAEGVAPVAATSATEDGTPVFSTLVLDAKAALSQPGAMDAVRARFGDDGASQLLNSLNQAQNPNVKEAVRKKHLQAVEEAMFWLNAQRVPGEATQAAIGADAREALPAPDAQTQVIGMESQPTGTMRVGPDGVAVPESRVDAINTAQAQQEIADTAAAEQEAADSIEPQARRASAVYGEGLPKRPAPPLKMPERTPRADAVEIDPAGPNAVARYIAEQAATNTPAARAFVQDYRAGRITDADVLALITPKPAAEPTPDERLAAAAKAGQVESDSTAGLILNREGKPFKTEMAAAREQKKHPGSQVVAVEGGHAVQPAPVEEANAQAPAATEAAAPQATESAVEEGTDSSGAGAPAAGDAGSAGVEAGSAGAVEAPRIDAKGAALQRRQRLKSDRAAGWTAFPAEMGSKGIPRADMPQIAAEHRGAMVNFLNARGIAHEQAEVPAADLKPTQGEYSTAKVEKAKAYEGGDRSILVSSDGHVLDGHHQWMAKKEAGELVKVIRLDAPIDKLLTEVREFPSASTSEESSPAAAPAEAATPEPTAEAKPEPAVNRRARKKAERAALAQAAQQNTPAADEGNADKPGPDEPKAALPEAADQQTAAPDQEQKTAGGAPTEATERPSEPKPEVAIPASTARVIARVGRTPTSAVALELRPNADGTVTPHMEDKALLDFDSGEPITLPAGMSDAEAKQAIRAAGALSSKQNFYAQSAFSRSQANEPSRRAKAVEALAAQITSRWKSAPAVVVVESMNDPQVPQAVRDAGDAQQSQGAQGVPEGFFHDGKVYLVAPQLGGDADVVRVLFHEALGHYGLRGTFGNELGTILDRLAVLNSGKVRAKAKQYGLDYDKPSDRRMAAEEVLAEMAERAPDVGWAKKAVAAIRTWLRQHVPGFSKMALSDEEIVRSFLLPARAFVQRGGAGEAGGAVSFSRNQATASDAFRKWFGDWDLAQPAARQASTFDEARKAAQAFQGRDLVNAGTGMVARVSRNSLDKMLSAKAVGKSEDAAMHSAAVANLDALFEGAMLGWSKPDRLGDPSIKAVHRFFAPLNVDGRVMLAKMTVKETARADQPNPLYTVEAVELNEKSPAAQWVDSTVQADGLDPTSIRSAGDVRSLAERVQAFNPAAVSKVVDAQGRPKVMYHGTAQDISTFKAKQAGAIFLTDDPTFAEQFAMNSEFWMLSRDMEEAAQNILPLYVKAASPFDYENGDQVEAVTKKVAEIDANGPKRDDIASGNWRTIENPAVQEALKALGHDGFYVEEEGRKNLAVYDSSQIKSVTGNRGSFDGANPDIAFSRSAPVGPLERLRRAGGGPKIIGDTGRTYTREQIGAMERVGFKVEAPTLEERTKALWQDAGKKLAQGLVDQFAPIKDIDAEAYSLLRLSKGASGAFEAMLQGGKLKLTDGVYDFDETQRGGVVDALLKPLGGEHHDFFRWVAANRAERLLGEGKEHLFTADDIKALKTLADGSAGFEYELQHGANAGTKTRSRSLIYADALKTFNGFNKNVLDMAEQSGLIDGESRKLWEHEFYVPFYRVAEEEGGSIGAVNIKGGAVRQQAFKQLKGGKQALNADLMDNTLMNWAHLLDASAKNRAAVATLAAAENMGAAVTAPEATAREMAESVGKKGNVVWVMDGGQKHFYVVDDPYVMTALTSLEYAGMRSPIMKALGSFKHALTLGVTASPFFKIRNLIRDSVQAIGASPLSYNVARNLTQGWKLTDPKSDAYFRLLAGGGTIHFGTMLEGSEAKRVQALVESGVSAGTILNSDQKFKAFYRKFIEPSITAYNELGNRGEAINRASLYAQLRQQGMNHAQASLQARDLMDFSMQGSFTSIRFLAQVVPFFNARLQGLYKLGRAAKEDPARISAVIGAAALASIALLLAYSGDDDWKKREEWDRNGFWWFKFGGVAFRIPKPFEVGAIATVAERGFELMFDKEMTGKRFRANVLALLGDNLSMNPIPQLAKPLLDVYANRDGLSGRPIETMAMEKLKSEYRFNSSTSMTARAISTGLNAVTGTIGKEALSPVQVDALLRGYFGWLGSFVVGIGDVIARPATGQPSKPSADMFKLVTGGMVSDLRDAPSRYVTQMYAQAAEIEQAYTTWKMLIKAGKPGEAAEFLADNKDDISKYRQVERLKKTESKLSQQIKHIEQGDGDSASKRDQIRVLQARRDEVARVLSTR